MHRTVEKKENGFDKSRGCSAEGPVAARKVNDYNSTSAKERARRKKGDVLAGYWLTSGSSIRVTIRHELYSHAHLHSRLHINIQGGRKTFCILDPPLVSFLLFAGISVGHRARSILRKRIAAERIRPIPMSRSIDIQTCLRSIVERDGTTGLPATRLRKNFREEHFLLKFESDRKKDRHNNVKFFLFDCELFNQLKREM